MKNKIWVSIIFLGIGFKFLGFDFVVCLFYVLKYSKMLGKGDYYVIIIIIRY